MGIIIRDTIRHLVSTTLNKAGHQPVRVISLHLVLFYKEVEVLNSYVIFADHIDRRQIRLTSKSVFYASEISKTSALAAGVFSRVFPRECLPFRLHIEYLSMAVSFKVIYFSM